MAADYKSTVLLPATDFPMKAELPKREPAFLERWDREKIFTRILDARAAAPTFSLHDGPPYANGHIHQGHTLNKILKDMVVKYKTMAGFKVDYIPGWDCHGLPIETALEKEMGAEAKNAMDRVAFRTACRAYAMKFVGIQRDEFKRLGVFGRWENPYLTMANGYEADIAREFGRFVGSGGAYKGLRPVHWCWSDRTALAEAEVEHAEREDPSIYVKFELPDDQVPPALKKEIGARKAFVVIWTTTPWTLPANVAIALNPELKYVAIEPTAAKGEAWIVAEGLLESFARETKSIEAGQPSILGTVDPKALENRIARHPFLDRGSRLVLADYVTLDAGTGCVHTAPGHGADDFATGRRYGLETLVPVNDRGILTAEAGPFAGQFIFKANEAIIAHLSQSGHLVATRRLKHDYPHCWRCKNPVIFRATTQWFVSMETNDLRKDALRAIDETKWIPAWGRERIYGMVEKRPDWCISRQRVWGVPIISFQCEDCGNGGITSQAIVERVASRFDAEGADAWYAHTARELLGNETACPKCASKNLRQEHDILDVWFESGVSFAAVCEKNPNLGFPVDLYLEGSDQHRGWFHSTLLAAVGTRGRNAYRSCLTHGFVVGSDGKKLSKSAKNYVAFEDVIAQNGAEILRLWVASSDYRDDIRLSREIMDRVKESYFKIRNTARFLLGNLSDFNPDTDRVKPDEMEEIDRWLLHRTAQLLATVKKAYEEYDFHVITREALNFCTVDVSAFYAAALKDRLYCDAKTSRARRSAQTALFEALSALTRALAPVLAFTTEEIWQAMPAWSGKETSVHVTRFPEAPAAWLQPALAERWEKLLVVRDVVLKSLEELRAAKAAQFKERELLRAKKDASTPEEKARLLELSRELVGGADEAEVKLYVGRDAAVSAAALHGALDALREALGAASLEVSEEAAPAGATVTAHIAAVVRHAKGAECARCRRWYPALQGDLCARCAKAVAA